MKKRTRLKNPKKAPLTYAIEDKYEGIIRNYVDETNLATTMSKSHIVTELIVESLVRRGIAVS